MLHDRTPLDDAPLAASCDLPVSVLRHRQQAFLLKVFAPLRNIIRPCLLARRDSAAVLVSNLN